MSLLVANIDYTAAIIAIRELVLDVSPVPCLEVFEQDFLLSKTSEGLVISGVAYPYTELKKFYDLTKKLVDLGITDYTILPEFVSVEEVKYIVEPTSEELDATSFTLRREHYFSTNTIDSIIEEFFAYYNPYDGVPKTTFQLFNSLDYFGRKKMIFWVAYYLVDKKRMYYASSEQMIDLANSSVGTTFKNTKESLTTKVGEVFTATETIDEDGKGLGGFTSLWGDKYSYYTKLQLYIRDRFERQFKDFSLRDDAMICQTFTIEKNWEHSAWINTMNPSSATLEIMNPDFRQ